MSKSSLVLAKVVTFLAGAGAGACFAILIYGAVQGEDTPPQDGVPANHELRRWGIRIPRIGLAQAGDGAIINVILGFRLSLDIGQEFSQCFGVQESGGDGCLGDRKSRT